MSYHCSKQKSDSRKAQLCRYDRWVGKVGVITDISKDSAPSYIHNAQNSICYQGARESQGSVVAVTTDLGHALPR